MRQVGDAFGLSPDSIYNWIHEGGERRERAWADAKRRSADALVDEGLRILDETEGPTNTAEVAAARARSEYRKWLAQVRDPGQYGGASAAMQVNLSIGKLHLDALRARGRMELAPGPMDTEVLPAEVVEQDEEDVLTLLREG